MQHLTLEALARLVDEAPTPQESVHVRDCILCRRELEAMRGDLAELREMDDSDPPLTAWADLEARLVDEGLVRGRAPAAAAPFAHPWLRAAAVAAVFVLGGAAGAALWSARAGTTVAAADGGAMLPGASAALPTRTVESGPSTPPLLVMEEPAPVAASAGARLAANGEARPAPAPRRAAPPTPAISGAARELARAEAEYLAALQRYAELADPASGADPQSRLAALDRLVEVTRSALDRAPGDAAINGYHLAAVRERDALRRQVERARAEENWF